MGRYVRSPAECSRTRARAGLLHTAPWNHRDSRSLGHVSSALTSCTQITIAEVYQDMPELSEQPKDIPVRAPFAPLLGVVVQRTSGPPYYRSIKGAVPSGDAFCELGHRRPAEVIWHIPNGQPESTVPLQVDPVLIGEFDEGLSDKGVRERRVRHQHLNITVRYDRAVDLGLNPSVQYTPRLA